MTTDLHLSADERTLLLYCIDRYRESVGQCEASGRFSAPSALTSRRAQALVETIYCQKHLPTALCAEVSDALLAWEAVTDQPLLPVAKLYEKLNAARSGGEGFTAR